MEQTLYPIGLIHTSFTDKSKTPSQPTRSRALGWVEVYPEFVAGLQDIEGFSHLILLYLFHQVTDYTIMVKPVRDDRTHGLFATRCPCRPNPIGLSVVKLIRRNGNELVVKGIDTLNETPLLDIKPYLPDFDTRSNVRTGWYASCPGQNKVPTGS